MSVHHEGGERASEPELPPNTAFGFAPFPARRHRGEEPEPGPERVSFEEGGEPDADEVSAPPE